VVGLGSALGDETHSGGAVGHPHLLAITGETPYPDAALPVQRAGLGSHEPGLLAGQFGFLAQPLRAVPSDYLSGAGTDRKNLMTTDIHSVDAPVYPLQDPPVDDPWSNYDPTCACGCRCGHCTHPEEDGSKPQWHVVFKVRVEHEDVEVLAALSRYLIKHYEKPTGRSYFVVSHIGSGEGGLTAVVDYRARGANTNDVRRKFKQVGRDLGATYVVHVTERTKIDVGSDPALAAAREAELDLD
jgi:hypothetical protein